MRNSVIIFTLIVILLVWSITWIIKGKNNIINNKITHNPRRILGYLFLFNPIYLLVTIVFYAMYLFQIGWLILFSIPLFLSIIYSLTKIIKNKIWSGFILLSISLLVPLHIVFYSSVSAPAPDNWGGSLETNSIPQPY